MGGLVFLYPSGFLGDFLLFSGVGRYTRLLSLPERIFLLAI
jgi:hypothetical protein